MQTIPEKIIIIELLLSSIEKKKFEDLYNMPKEENEISTAEHLMYTTMCKLQLMRKTVWLSYSMSTIKRMIKGFCFLCQN